MGTIKIILVEDEAFALQALEFKVHELGADYEVIDTAENGYEGLEKILSLKPDIVITDIRMPDMDGLTMIEQMQEQKCEALPIVLTGYQEFEYARQAVRLGVHDYLLKPVDPGELRSCLEHCSALLAQQSSVQNASSFLVGESASLVSGNTESFFAAGYCILSNALTNPDNIIHPNVPYVVNSKLERLLTQHLPSDISVHPFDGLFSNEKVIFLSGTSKTFSELQPQLSAFLDSFANEYDHFATLFLEFGTFSESVSHTILRCRKNAVRSVFLWQNRVSCAPSELSSVLDSLKEPSELLGSLLMQNQLDLLRSNIKQLLYRWVKQEFPAYVIESNLTFLLAYLSHFCCFSGMPDSSFWIENLLSFSTDWDDLANNFFQVITDVFSPSLQPVSASAPQASSEQLVDKIDEYMRLHLSAPLTLQSLSEQTGISKMHLCRIFKKCKSTTPIDYFNNLRIDHAKKLLTEFSAMPLREIAEGLGFNDTYYFSKVFKRLTGISPSDYRANPLSGNNASCV